MMAAVVVLPASFCHDYGAASARILTHCTYIYTLIQVEPVRKCFAPPPAQSPPSSQHHSLQSLQVFFHDILFANLKVTWKDRSECFYLI